MFFYFFEEYKEKAYKESRKSLVWFEYVLIAFIVVFALLVPLSFLLKWNLFVKIACIIALASSFVVSLLYCEITMKKNREQLTQDHIDKHTERLRELIRKYDLYTTNGIDWLIECCENKKSRKNSSSLWSGIKTSFSSYVYPCLTLTLGLILRDVSSQDIINFISSVLVLYAMGIGLVLFVQPVIQVITFPEKDIVAYLRDDLEYLKAQIAAK